MRRCSATCGVLRARLRLSRTSPTFSAASLIVLHSPVTMASMAARTLFEMRFGGPISVVGAGWSRTASARLAGVPGGVMFSMVAPWALGVAAQRTTRDVFRVGPLRDSKAIASKATDSTIDRLNFSGTTPRGTNGLTSDSPMPGKWPSALCDLCMTRFGSRPGLVSIA
jgi:uncharacterized membrane protein